MLAARCLLSTVHARLPRLPPHRSAPPQVLELPGAFGGRISSGVYEGTEYIYLTGTGGSALRWVYRGGEVAQDDSWIGEYKHNKLSTPASSLAMIGAPLPPPPARLRSAACWRGGATRWCRCADTGCAEPVVGPAGRLWGRTPCHASPACCPACCLPGLLPAAGDWVVTMTNGLQSLTPMFMTAIRWVGLCARACVWEGSRSLWRKRAPGAGDAADTLTPHACCWGPSHAARVLLVAASLSTCGERPRGPRRCMCLPAGLLRSPAAPQPPTRRLLAACRSAVLQPEGRLHHPLRHPLRG